MARMDELAPQQAGYLGIDSVSMPNENREEIKGITVSYWKDEQSVKDWKKNLEHLGAQKKGRKDWYERFQVRICRVERVIRPYLEAMT